MALERDLEDMGSRLDQLENAKFYARLGRFLHYDDVEISFTPYVIDTFTGGNGYGYDGKENHHSHP